MRASQNLEELKERAKIRRQQKRELQTGSDLEEEQKYMDRIKELYSKKRIINLA